MHGSRLSRFPHLSWMQFRLHVPPGSRRLALHVRGTAYAISIALNGSRAASRITHGRQVDWNENSGMLSCVSADDQQHTYPMISESGCNLFAAFIPQDHFETMTLEEGLGAATEWPPMLGIQDPVLGDCMARLATATTGHDTALDVHTDEVARRLILRLAQRAGRGTPDWHDDASLFERRTLLNLVSHVDQHLRCAPSLSDMALLAGMSPSHFARKFRHSTGLSLGRFINHRRVLQSLETLKGDSSPASIALDLGFSSQSHFTRIFSGLTGMTPANYQRSVRRVMG